MMHETIGLALKIIALAPLFLAALDVRSHQLNWMGVGLFLWLLGTLIEGR